MRIMHLVLTPRFSGAEILVRDLCIAQKSMGHDVAFAAINPSEKSFLIQLENLKYSGVIVQVPKKVPLHFQRIFRIRQLILDFKPDVIFAHSVIPAMYARLADIIRRRVVPVLHATDNHPQGSAHRIVEYLLCYLSRYTIAVSEEGACNYRKLFPVPIRVIRNGLDFTSAQIAAAHRFARVKKSGIIIQIGRVLPLKGQHISIQAMAEVIKQHPQAKLWLVGIIEDQSYYAELKSIIGALGVEQSVEFLGPRSDVFDLLGMADVYIMPSSVEAHSVAMLEALATGIPVVASEIPAFAQFSGADGVQLVPRESLKAWVEGISIALNEGAYFFRNMSSYDIEGTAADYLLLNG